jgi:ribosome biogenesis GTPase
LPTYRSDDPEAEEQLDYEDYDEAFEDAAHEETELLAKKRRKSKPKKASSNLIPGIVIRALGHHYDVQTNPESDPDAPGHIRLCEVRRRLLQEKSVDTLVAVGDRVWLVPDGNKGGKIERIDERKSVLSRQQPGASQLAEDVILANPDQALIVFSIVNPAPHPRMLDRFLVIAEFAEIPAIICVNKIDLAELEQAKTLFAKYEKIGYRVIYASAETGLGMAELEELLTDRITVVTGPSGVGKSSLLNTIHPDLQLETGDLRDFLNKGKHTTRTAHLIGMPFGTNTFVADTPGIRELGLYDIDPADMGFYFVEMEPFLHQCRFPNCTHDHEPGCTVRGAVDAGEIDAVRYDSYLRLMRGEE